MSNFAISTEPADGLASYSEAQRWPSWALVAITVRYPYLNVNVLTARKAWMCRHHCGCWCLLKHRGISIHSDEEIFIILCWFNTKSLLYIYSEHHQTKLHNKWTICWRVKVGHALKCITETGKMIPMPAHLIAFLRKRRRITANCENLKYLLSHPDDLQVVMCAIIEIHLPL